MALALSQTQRNSVSGNRRTSYLTGTFSGTYSAGGEIAALTDYVPRIDHVSISTDEPDNGYILKWDGTNSKIQIFEQTDPADTGGANLPLVEEAGTIAITCQIAVTGGRA